MKDNRKQCFPLGASNTATLIPVSSPDREQKLHAGLLKLALPLGTLTPTQCLSAQTYMQIHASNLLC